MALILRWSVYSEISIDPVILNLKLKSRVILFWGKSYESPNLYKICSRISLNILEGYTLTPNIYESGICGRLAHTKGVAIFAVHIIFYDFWCRVCA